MSSPAPSDPKLTPASAEPIVAPALEHHLHGFWQKNARAVYAACAIIVIAIVGKGAYELYERAQRKETSSDYAAASTSEKLKTFAASHQGSELSGVAYLRLADEAYAAANYTQAIPFYQSATESLKDVALVGRARLGAAVAKLQGGQAADGEAQLKMLANGTQQLKTVRAEACYHLASLAVSQGKNDEAAKYLDQLNAAEPAGLWAQRALSLRSMLPTPAALNPAPTSQIKLPAKP